jgi:glycerophosphoryl diester phosphodiesterase
MAERSCMVIAHRTCPNHAPENSLAGIRRAAELGADAVEIDVRLTLDGDPVLVHDRTLRRTTGVWGPTYLRRSARVESLEIGDGESVPSFAAALAALPGGLRMAIDVKVARAVHPVLAEIVNQHAEARVLLWSQHPSVVRFSADGHPEIESSLLRDTRTAWGQRAFLRAAKRCRADGISAQWSAVTPEFVEQARTLGLRVYSWCRTNVVPAATLALLDGVVSDWPGDARESVDAVTARP